MNCNDFSRLLEAARDASVLEATRDASGVGVSGLDLDEHARRCASCSTLRAAERGLQRDLAWLRSRPVVVPAGFAMAVRRRLATQRARPSLATWPVALSALASAAAVGLVILVSWREAPGPTQPASLPVVTRPASTVAGAPILWSDGRVEVVSGEAGRATPPFGAIPHDAGLRSSPLPHRDAGSHAAPNSVPDAAPDTVPDARPVAVLVEYHL